MDKSFKVILIAFVAISTLFCAGLAYSMVQRRQITLKYNELVSQHQKVVDNYNSLAEKYNQLIILLNHTDPQVEANVHVQIEDGMGTHDAMIGNAITDWGENLTRNVFFNGSGNGVWAENCTIDNIAIGNHSSSVTGSTALASEGDRKDVGPTSGANITLWTNGGDFAANVTYKFVEPTFACNATALHTENTGSNAAAIATFTQQTGTYNITITWTITYNGN